MNTEACTSLYQKPIRRFIGFTRLLRGVCVSSLPLLLKLPQIYRLTTTQAYYFTDREIRSPKNGYHEAKTKVSAGRRPFLQGRICFQLWRWPRFSAHISDHITPVSASIILSSLTIQPPSLTYKETCDPTGLTQITQGNVNWSCRVPFAT